MIHAVVLSFIVLLVGVIESHAGRPMRIDDADPVDPGKYEIEAGLNYIQESTCRHWDYPFGVNYGIVRRVEVSGGFGGQFEERTEDASNVYHAKGLCDLVLGTKVNIIRESTWIPRQALSGAIKIPTADDEDGLGTGRTDYDLSWISSKALNSMIGTHVNIGYSWIGRQDGSETGDIVHYGFGMDLQISEQFQWIGEVFCEKELRSGTGTLLQCSCGLRFEVLDGLVFDLAAGTKLHGEAPTVTATAGVTWVFGD